MYNSYFRRSVHFVSKFEGEHFRDTPTTGNRNNRGKSMTSFSSDVSLFSRDVMKNVDMGSSQCDVSVDTSITENFLAFECFSELLGEQDLEINS